MMRQEFWWYDVRDRQYKCAFTTEGYMLSTGVAFSLDLNDLKDEVEEQLNEIAGMASCEA